MNLNLIIQLILSLVTGMLLGAIFFGGLWMTVQKLQEARRPWLLFLVSSLGRTAITIAGFWLIGIWLAPTDQWQRILICLVGFIIVRHVFTRQIKTENSSVSGKSLL